jgi:glycosyltransferase involved in cell wall biosynthesis
MRICLVADRLPGFHEIWSGQEILCMNLGDELRARGHTVSFLTLPKDHDNPDSDLQVDFVRRGLVKANGLARHFSVDRRMVRSAKRYLRERRAEVVHFHSHILFPAIMRAATELGIPTVFTVVDQHLLCPRTVLTRRDDTLCSGASGGACAECYEAQLDRMRRRFLMPGVAVGALAKRFYDARIKSMQRLMGQLSALVCLSKTSLERHVAIGFERSKAHVIYHMRIPTPPAPEPLFERPTVTYIGTLTPTRGPQRAVEAMPEILKRIPDAELRLVGASQWDFEVALRDTISAKGLEKHVLLMGKLPNDEARRTVARSHVSVVPLQWPNDYGPISLLEAKSMGRPVVASRIGATEEFLRDGVDGFIVPHDDAAAFADRIAWLMENTDKADEMGREGQEWWREFESRGHWEKLEQLYADLAQKAGKGLG